MSWTPVTEQTETWSALTQETRVFSPVVFSHAYHTGKRVFSIGSVAGIWDNPAAETETWVPA